MKKNSSRPRAARSAVRLPPPGPPAPSTRFGKAVGDVMLLEDWHNIGTLQLWVGGDRVAGAIALLDVEGANALASALWKWTALPAPAPAKKRGKRS